MPMEGEPVNPSARSRGAMTRIYEKGRKQETWTGQTTLWPDEEAVIQAYCEDLGSRILNVGCGAGRETFALYSMGYRHLWGVDPTPEMLIHAQRRAEAEDLPLTFEIGHAGSTPFADSSFDVVTLFENVLGLITPHRARLEALAETARVLAPGGRAIIFATSLHHSHRFRLALTAMELGRRMYDPHHLERGDKPMKKASYLGADPGEWVPRSHWFRPGEIEADAGPYGLVPVLTSTSRGVLVDPRADDHHLHGRGRFVYVLAKADRSPRR
jgi:ubiquinone/menaquinone biosynthesis C-methylase UbiE